MIYFDNCSQKNTKPQTSRYGGFHRSASFWYERKEEGNKEVFNYLQLLLGTGLAAAELKRVDRRPCRIYELMLGAGPTWGGGVIAACDNHAGIVFRFGWSVLIWGAAGAGLPLGVPGRGCGRLRAELQVCCSRFVSAGSGAVGWCGDAQLFHG